MWSSQQARFFHPGKKNAWPIRGHQTNKKVDLADQLVELLRLLDRNKPKGAGQYCKKKSNGQLTLGRWKVWKKVNCELEYNLFYTI